MTSFYIVTLVTLSTLSITHCRSTSQHSSGLESDENGRKLFGDYRALFKSRTDARVRNMMFHLIESENLVGKISWSCQSSKGKNSKLETEFKKYTYSEDPTKTNLYKVEKRTTK